MGQPWPDIYYVDFKLSDEMASFAVNGNLYSICTEDGDCTDNAQQIFWRENEECLLFTMDWTGRLLVLVFFSHRRCFLCNDVMPTEKESSSGTCFCTNLNL